MNPTVARVVHYQTYGKEEGTLAPLAAIVTETHVIDTRVDLAVFYRAELMFHQNVPYSETPKLGHWNWPPKS